jgi:hypothetical protein
MLRTLAARRIDASFARSAFRDLDPGLPAAARNMPAIISMLVAFISQGLEHLRHGHVPL